MKLQKRILRLSLYFSLLIIISCDPSPTTPDLMMPDIHTETAANFTSTPTLPSQTPTALVIPSATIATVAVVPTLESEKTVDLLHHIFEGSPDCQLPCWAGIKPGLTTNAEAERLLQPLSVLIYGGPFYSYKEKELSGSGGGRNFFFGDTRIRFDFDWVTERDKDIVEMIEISADALNQNSEWIYGAQPYNQLFEEYNLHNILLRNGIPSQVWTIAEVYNYGNDRPHPNPEEFDILLFYDQGIFIKYTMPLKRGNIENRGEACPSEAFFNLGLVAPGSSTFYQGLWFSGTTGSNDFSYYKPIEQATQMTLDEFYKAFKEPNNPCFDVPLDIWSEH